MEKAYRADLETVIVCYFSEEGCTEGCLETIPNITDVINFLIDYNDYYSFNKDKLRILLERAKEQWIKEKDEIILYWIVEILIKDIINIQLHKK